MAIGKPAYKRSVRVRELYLQQITLGLRAIEDPGLAAGLLTITDLELARDMKSAKVFYSLLGSAQDREMVKRALERAVPHLRRQVLARLRLKFIPRLVFIYDDTPAQAQKIESVLDRIHAEEAGEERAFKQDAAALDDLASRGRKRRRRRR